MNVSFGTNDNGAVQRPSRAKSAVSGALISAGVGAGILACDQYFPSVTKKVMAFPFSVAKEELSKPIFHGWTLKFKVKTVAVVGVLAGVLSAIFVPKEPAHIGLIKKDK